MIRARQIAAPILGLACLLASATAPAATLDFTSSSAWSSANGLGSFTNGLATLTALASGGSPAPTLLFNSGGLCSGGSPALACNGGGIGVNAPVIGSVDILPTIDAIGRTESLRLSFAQPVHILSIEVLSLYTFTIPATFITPQIQTVEHFNVSINGNAPTTYGGPNQSFSGSNPGYYLQAFDRQGVSSLLFETSTLGLALGVSSDFTLARITYDVPEPGALALLGAGALALFARTRGRRERSSAGR